jgi:DNA mismatch repair protein MutH
VTAPRSEAELLARARALAGLELGAIARELGWPVPRDLRRHKGWVGELIERALGADAGNRPLPDFAALGIELKTIPVGADGRPRESTHVCAIALDDVDDGRWASSLARRKMARVLWLPVEAAPALALPTRRVGRAFLWSPSVDEELVLRQDWEELMELVRTGRLDQLDARLGSYLQVRPKAADGRALTAAADADGAPGASLPRGFYLRPAFTRHLLERATLAA